MGLSDIFSKLNDKKDDSNLATSIGELFDSSNNNPIRKMMEDVWYRNLLFYLGEQWIEYLPSTRSFRRRIMPDYIPTPVDNQIIEFVRSVKSLLLGQKLITKVAPNTNEKEDTKAAELAELLLEYLDSYNDGEFLDELEKCAICVPLYGVGFMRTFPKMFDDRWMFDKEGNIIPTGEIGVENIIPFQVYVDALGDRLEKKRWIGIQSLKSKEWVEDTFKVKVSSQNANSVDYISRISKLVRQTSTWKGRGYDASNYTIDDDSLVLFREIEMKPTIKYPNGRYIISCDDKILKKYDRMPIPMSEGKWFYSLTDFHYDYMPGNFWSEAGVSNLISPQITINEIDQALAINRKGVARPKMFTPGKIGIKKADDVGALGIGMQVIEYDPLLSGGQKPEIDQGTPLPQQVLEERAIQRTSIQDIGGDPKNILRGQSPGAKASGIMVDTLRETAERGKAPDMERFVRSRTRVQKKRLLLAQEIFTEERMLKICGKGNKWKIVRFKASDLRNNTDVRMELDSGLSTTNSGKMSMLLDFAQRGLLGDVPNNPELRDELFRRAGLSGFTTQESIDSRRAETENAKMSIGDFQGIMLVDQDPQKGGITENSTVLSNDPLFRFDNHNVHLETHRKFILGDEFSELPQEIQTQAIAHVALHQNMIEEEQKNAKPEPKDPREFVQMDKLFQDLTAKEQISYLPTIGIEPDVQERMSGVAGVLNRKDVFNAEQELILKQIDGSNKMNQEVIKSRHESRESNESRTGQE